MQKMWLKSVGMVWLNYYEAIVNADTEILQILRKPEMLLIVNFFQGSPYDINSPTDSVIGADFQGLTAEEQERQREEWKAELKKTEEEILTLKQVLTAKERHAAGNIYNIRTPPWAFPVSASHGSDVVNPR